MERFEELKRQVATEIERARQNVRDIHVVEKEVWSNLAKARSLLRERRPTKSPLRREW
jgi:hypothetical protein